ncbi:MAG: hypothetical protein Q4D13_07385 [Erysipelotrichaceae bacterium]|nr:hypothetical protein [Erysipelotrichaceae bacterium]
MNVLVSLKNLNEHSVDEVLVEDVRDCKNFTYIDNEGCLIEMSVHDDGIDIIRHGKGYVLEVLGHTEKTVRITSNEGVMELPLKDVDFICSNDILAMHYFLEKEERTVEIRYI